jgi:hypothetical protein
MTNAIFNLPGGLLARKFPAYANALVLLAGVAERQSLPTDYNYVVFSGTGLFYVKLGTSGVTATVPSDTSDGTASELGSNGYLYDATEHTHVSIVAAADTTVTLSYYAVR